LLYRLADLVIKAGPATIGLELRGRFKKLGPTSLAGVNAFHEMFVIFTTERLFCSLANYNPLFLGSQFVIHLLLLEKHDAAEKIACEPSKTFYDIRYANEVLAVSRFLRGYGKGASGESTTRKIYTHNPRGKFANKPAGRKESEYMLFKSDFSRHEQNRKTLECVSSKRLLGSGEHLCSGQCSFRNFGVFLKNYLLFSTVYGHCGLLAGLWCWLLGAVCRRIILLVIIFIHIISPIFKRIQIPQQSLPV
jgi:hypothetical protein